MRVGFTKWFSFGRLCAVGIGLAAFLVASAAALPWYRTTCPAPHFAAVVPGVLYRSGQPEGADWGVLFEHYGIRTVVDLRSEGETPAPRREASVCGEYGVRFIHMPVGDERLTAEQLDRLLETVADPDRRPVLIHCEYGKSRTGLAVAAYRIAAQGWSCDRALAELREFKEEMRPEYVSFLRSLPRHARPGGQRGPADGHTSVADGTMEVCPHGSRE